MVNKMIEESFSNIAKAISESFARLNEDIRKSTQKIAEQFREISEQFQKIPERIRVTSQKLADRGWYMSYDFDLAQLSFLEKKFIGSEDNEIDEYLCKIIKSQLKEIQDTLESRFPHRAQIFRSAFNAHKENEFYLSIPVFLTQVDGICFDLFQEKFFKHTIRKARDVKDNPFYRSRYNHIRSS